VQLRQAAKDECARRAISAMFFWALAKIDRWASGSTLCQIASTITCNLVDIAIISVLAGQS
jgi:hypothetical protein